MMPVGIRAVPGLEGALGDAASLTSVRGAGRGSEMPVHTSQSDCVCLWRRRQKEGQAAPMRQTNLLI